MVAGLRRPIGATDVSAHYARGDLRQRFLDAISAAGLDPARLGPDDLAEADEFHMGGRAATVDLFDQLPLAPRVHLLDLGSGIGGPARFAASHYGCRVTGIDLTPEFVALARFLADVTGLAARLDFGVANLCELPFRDQVFDGVCLLHVGINAPDKDRLFAEAARVVRSGGFLAVYEPMRVGGGEIDFPVPWAGSPDMSFLETPEVYRAAIADAGFRITAVRERAELALAFFARLRARAHNPPALGLHLLLGDDSRDKVAHMLAAVEDGVLAPVEMVAVAPDRPERRR